MSERLYEGMFLLDANEASKGWSDLESHITGLLGKHQAHLEYSERWPDQRLASEVKGVKKGTYFLTYFRAPTASIAPLRRDVELSDRILRFLVIQEDFLGEEMTKRKEHSRRRAEQPAPAPAAAAAAASASGRPESGAAASSRDEDEPEDE